MARKSKASAAKRRPVVKEEAVPGGKILTRENGTERFVTSSSGTLPRATYTKVKRSSGNIQGKIV